MRGWNDEARIRCMLWIIVIAVVVVFVLFGDDIMQWLLQGMDASVESDLQKILG